MTVQCETYRRLKELEASDPRGLGVVARNALVSISDFQNGFTEVDMYCLALMLGELEKLEPASLAHLKTEPHDCKICEALAKELSFPPPPTHT